MFPFKMDKLSGIKIKISYWLNSSYLKKNYGKKEGVLYLFFIYFAFFQKVMEEGLSQPKEENNSKDYQMNIEKDMFEVKEEMMDFKESPLTYPNENNIAEEFVERNLHLFIDKVIHTDGEDSKDFQVKSEKDLFGIKEEIFDSKDDPLSFSIENGIKEEFLEKNLDLFIDKTVTVDTIRTMPINFTPVHEGKKPFKCDICDYCSSRKSHMNRHIESVHEGKKPFKCEICDYSCSLKKTMKIHAASVHEGLKPFKCHICDYCCSQKGNMNRHVASVHEGKKLFRCEICDYSCSLKTTMKKHVASLHGGKKETIQL